MSAKPMSRADASSALEAKVRASLRLCGLEPDTYDASVILGGITRFLHDHDLVLTGTGVERWDDLAVAFEASA